MSAADRTPGPRSPDDGPPDPERALAISYAPGALHRPLAALLALDRRLATILQTTREPLIGQMRLTWWHDALSALDGGAPPPAEPLLVEVSAALLPAGIAGAELAGLVEGWEALLEGGDAERHADARGARLFQLAARLLGAADVRVGEAGAGWALADLARHASDPMEARDAREGARRRLAGAFRAPWPRPLRALGAMALLARLDVMEPPVATGHPRRVARLLWHRLSGR